MTKRGLLYALGSLLWLSVSAPTSARADDDERLAVVVGADSSVSGLTFYELKQLYMGQKQKTPTGEWLIPLNLKANTPERVGFEISVLGMSPEVVTQYWVDRKIRGQSNPPKAIRSSALVLRLVAKVPGAIGYVRASEAQGLEGVRIIKIDGQYPGEPGYGIRL